MLGRRHLWPGQPAMNVLSLKQTSSHDLNLTIDYIVAVSKGGADHIDNLQLLCGACNSTKGAGANQEFAVAGVVMASLTASTRRCSTSRCPTR